MVSGSIDRHYEQKRVEVFFTAGGDAAITVTVCVFFGEAEGLRMQILYEANKDLLYFRLDERKQQGINRRVSEDVVLDVGEGDRIVGVEFLDASKRLNLGSLLPVRYGAAPAAA